MPKPLILIDGSSWLFRAYHALPPLTNSRGEATGAVYGMANMLRKLAKDYAPERIAVVFDVPGKTFRDELYPQYKATRDETPDDLHAQFPRIVELVRALGLPVLEVAGVEADDVIGTLTVQARAAGIPVLIVTGDKDMAQLVDSEVRILDTMKNRTLDAAAVVEKFGVPPERMVEYLALVGDTSDNIPGVPLVGPKRAAEFLNRYGSLEALMQKAGEVKGKVGENLRASLGQIPLARQLATIRCDVPLPVTLEDLKPAAPDREKLAALYERLGFTRWLEELDSPLPPGEAARSAGEGARSVAPAPPHPGEQSSPPSPVHTISGEGTGPCPEGRGDKAEESPRTRHELVLDEAALEAMVRRLEQAPLICFDTETDSLDAQQAHLVGLAFAIEAGHGWYVPVDHRYLGVPAQLPLEKVLERIRPVMQDAARPKLGQHLKYDLNVLHQHGLQVQGLAYDTLLESFVLDAGANRHDMDTLAEKHLNHRTIRYADVTGKGKARLSFEQVEVEKAAAYSAEDADITLRLHQVLYPQVTAEPGLQRVFEEIEMPLVPVLAQIERNGVLVDGKLLAAASREFAQRMDELQTQAWKEAGTEFNLGSPPQLQEILYEKLKLPVAGRTPKGQPSTDEDALDTLAEQHPLPRVILDWRALSKLRSTYTELLPRAINPRTGRIHTSYHQAGAATGRLSSSDPNLQNIPVKSAEGRRIREAFIAPPGHLLLSIDYSQIELRLMAHLSGDPRLRDAFIKGQDIHQATAAEVFGLPLEQVGSDQRRAAKAINFGLIYGMSAFGLARQLGIARGEAQQYMDKFFERYAGVRAFMDDTRARAKRQGYVETLFGRRLYLPNINSKNASLRGYAERTAINAPLQGTAADLIKLAMVALHRWIAEQAPELRMIMQVHDELVFEGPAAAVNQAAGELATRMCGVSQLSVPLVADFGAGTQWNQAHTASGHASSLPSQ